jgi:hypothetical protein
VILEGLRGDTATIGKAERTLRELCIFSIVWILGFQALGLMNILTRRPSVDTGSVLLTGTVCVAVWWLACKPAFPGIPSLPDALRIPVGILGVTYTLFLCDALASFPNGFDAVAYHLPAVVSGLQNASFRLMDLKWNAALPANAELFALPALALNLQGLAFPGNLMATAILALSVYALGMRVSGSSGGAWLAVLIALSIPLVIFQTFYFNVDVFGAAFLAEADHGLFWLPYAAASPWAQNTCTYPMRDFCC